MTILRRHTPGIKEVKSSRIFPSISLTLLSIKVFAYTLSFPRDQTHNRDQPRFRDYSQWCGLGGSSLGCATVDEAKLLKAADEGLMQRGTRLQLIWSWMNLCNLSFTLETQVSSRSQRSSKGRSATGSKSVVYRRGPAEPAEPFEPEEPLLVLEQQLHMQEWYLE